MSDRVRDYLAANPTATVNQIVDALQPYGVSQSLAQKIKYNKQTNSGRKPRRRKAAAAAVANESHAGAGNAEPKKADAIRRVAEGMRRPVRPRNVIAALNEEGISVGFAQVSQVLKKMGMRRRRPGRKPAGSAASPRRAEAPVATALSLEALMGAKRLADQLGGVQAAKLAMDALAKLS